MTQLPDERPLAVGGVFEFAFGVAPERQDFALRHWNQLGFRTVAQGYLDEGESEGLYGHRAGLHSFRLAHPGCLLSGCGYVRLMVWEQLANEGLDSARPIDVGGRWMGLYTRDLLAVYQAYEDGRAQGEIDCVLSPLKRSAQAPPPFGFFRPFYGLREMFVVAPDFRLAFLQRGGFERPGFGSFIEGIPFRNTEGTHANYTQPAGSFSTQFYRELLGLQTSLGPVELGGDDTTPAVLMLRPGQRFQMEQLVTPGCDTGRLQIYCPSGDAEDARDRSRPGSRGISLFSYRVRDLGELGRRARTGGASVTKPFRNEFGETAVGLVAPDGAHWTFVGAEER